MKIFALTNRPTGLADEITKSINRTVYTWSQPNKNIPRFVHTLQWEEKGFVEMTIGAGYVEFSIGVTGSQPVNDGYIVGRFVEVLMVHFSSRFSKLEVLP